MDRWVEKLINGQMDGEKNERIDGLRNDQMNRWVEKLIDEQIG